MDDTSRTEDASKSLMREADSNSTMGVTGDKSADAGGLQQLAAGADTSSIQLSNALKVLEPELQVWQGAARCKHLQGM